jgi:hypothetical protein
VFWFLIATVYLPGLSGKCHQSIAYVWPASTVKTESGTCVTSVTFLTLFSRRQIHSPAIVGEFQGKIVEANPILHVINGHIRSFWNDDPDSVINILLFTYYVTRYIIVL